MLKKSLKNLVEKNQLDADASFEIIHDQNAMSVAGGTTGCPKLETCVEYSGDCPNLTSCGTFQ
ncbi:MAG: hypothetical protein JWQ09_2559 [Segetibacter sp.]|nr:hypothetical protein [Segetibacter sp.]